MADAQSDTASVAGEEYHTVKHDTSDSGESIFSRADKTEQNETVIPESKTHSLSILQVNLRGFQLCLFSPLKVMEMKQTPIQVHQTCLKTF